MAQRQWYSRTWLAALLALTTLVPVTVHAQPQPPTIPFVPVDKVPDPDDDSLLMLVPLLISPNCQVPTSPQFSNGQPLYAGQVITLTVFCSHSPPNYVWSLNGVVIANATTATITFTVPSGMSSAVFTVTTTANGARPYRAGMTRTINVLPAANQSITFGVLPSKLLIDLPFNLTATASSGLPVTFSTTTPAFCSVNGVSVTLHAVGTCTIVASQAGNAATTTAVSVSRSFEVESEIYYVHADHLGTPRAITRPSDNQVVWKWENSDPFGANAPNEDPSNTGTAFKYNLRFPGQYYDQETGTHYNYFRDYDPTIGRYIQSDPIGLEFGLNTYEYVESDPLGSYDDDGLLRRLIPLLTKAKKPGGRPPPQNKDTEIRKPDKKPGNWSCNAIAKCNDNQPGNCPEDPWKRFAFGGGVAKNQDEARNIAKSNATKNLGCQPKHVSCICTGPKGEPYQGGC